eukprot:364183-Chlamydomonas_euryale.AAC.21
MRCLVRGAGHVLCCLWVDTGAVACGRVSELAQVCTGDWVFVVKLQGRSPGGWRVLWLVTRLHMLGQTCTQQKQWAVCGERLLPSFARGRDGVFVPGLQVEGPGWPYGYKGEVQETDEMQRSSVLLALAGTQHCLGLVRTRRCAYVRAARKSPA